MCHKITGGNLHKKKKKKKFAKDYKQLKIKNLCHTEILVGRGVSEEFPNFAWPGQVCLDDRIRLSLSAAMLRGVESIDIDSRAHRVETGDWLLGV